MTLPLAAMIGGVSALFAFIAPSSAPAIPRAAPAMPQEGLLQLDPVDLSAAEQTVVYAGRIVLREIPRPGLKGRTFEAVGILPSTLDQALAVVTDYRRYAEFMPRVERAVVTEESEAVFLVEQYLKLPLGVHRRFRLRYTSRRSPDGFRVDWVKVPWPEVPTSHSIGDTSGHWQISRFGEGRLLAVYHVYLDPGRVPMGMKGLALSISKHDIPKVIEAVRERLKEGGDGSRGGR